MLFLSSKNKLLYVLMIFICLFLVTIMFVLPLDKRENQPPDWIFYIIISIIVIGLIWILLETKYFIKDKFLFYRSGPIRGKIEIQKIKKIQYHSGMMLAVTLKPALDTKGLIITYNEYDEIYVSPKEQKQFIDELQTVNPNIIVK